MTRIFDYDEGPTPPPARDDDEGLFSRDISGQLVRLDAPTEEDYGRTAALQIDGQPIEMPLAEPLKDAQGNIVVDIDGRTTPRYTTIYDAAVRLYVKQPGDEAKIPIPILCHQPHMTPVAVCRLCVVQIYGQKRGERAAERKLLPACQHQVKDGMEVFTMNAAGPDGERVRQSVKLLTELLAAQHLKPAPPPAPAAELARFNELQRMSERVGANSSRFKAGVLRDTAAADVQPAAVAANVSGVWGSGAPPAPPVRGGPSLPVLDHRPLDNSSPVFLIDHSACILCERCARACDEVKKNHVIGRTGKGATAGISFDLDTPMGQSSCVQCGECMVSCPTTAITFKPVARVKLRSDDDGKAGGSEPAGGDGAGAAADTRERVLLAEDLAADPLFAGVPFKFLLWQQGLAVRRPVRAGEVLCRQGESGNTAFLIKRGRLEVTAWPTAKKSESAGGVAGLITGLTVAGRALLGGKRGANDRTRPGGDRTADPLARFELSPADVILGEMACLSGSPRTADVTAVTDGEVWEIRRNVLDRLMRSPSQRGRFEAIYRGRALDTVLRSPLFHDLWTEEYRALVDFLRPRLTFVRVDPGQTIFRQGDRADTVLLVRLGHVRIGISRNGRETSVLFRGPGSVVGEIGLLAISAEDTERSLDDVDEGLGAALQFAKGPLTNAIPAGLRSATCSALDHLELARLGRADFLEMIKRFPTIRRRLVQLSLDRLRHGNEHSPVVREYVKQGLYQGQSMLVLDLTRCTRCDECTKACVDQHGTESHGTPIARLLRDGKQFGDYLVTTSCRSCKDAYCMIGCPVDAIHRGRHQQIVIEDHCIGCGLCASNCPYGNIWMVPNQKRLIESADPDHPGQTRQLARPKAATCDLCDAEGARDEPLPRCVYACPHDAAHRMTGEALLSKVTAAAESGADR